MTTQKGESTYEEIHQMVTAVRGRLAESVGRVLVEEAVGTEQYGVMGLVKVPIAKVRAIVFGLMEIAHLLALGDPEGGMQALTSLAPLVRGMPPPVQQVVRAEIARGMVGKPDATVEMQEIPAMKGPIGQA